MKIALLTVALLGILGLGTHDVQAQYGPYYSPYEDGIQYQPPVQQSNPYYLLEVIHYQLYLPYHQPYPVYQLYQSCCIAGAVVIPRVRTLINPSPRVIISPRATRRK
jgi:hypothetical protein